MMPTVLALTLSSDSDPDISPPITITFPVETVLRVEKLDDNWVILESGMSLDNETKSSCNTVSFKPI